MAKLRLDFNNYLLKALLYFIAYDLVSKEFEDLLKFDSTLFLSLKQFLLTIFYDIIGLSKSYLDFNSYSWVSDKFFTLFKSNIFSDFVVICNKFDFFISF